MIRELLPPETGLAFDAIRALRTDLSDEEAFVRLVDEVQRAEGYRLIGAFEDGKPRAAAVAGFRVATASPGATTSTSTTSRPCPRQGVADTAKRFSSGWRTRASD